MRNEGTDGPTQQMMDKEYVKMRERGQKIRETNSYKEHQRK